MAHSAQPRKNDTPSTDSAERRTLAAVYAYLLKLGRQAQRERAQTAQQANAQQSEAVSHE